jgi:hypothetical protein
MAGSPPPLPDLLSSLPLKVLDNILSRMHVYDVVCTSALSRVWRPRWESLPTVNLTCSRGIVAHEVDALLLRRSAPIRTFRLAAFDDSWYVDALHDWILYLSRNGVENLFLWFPRRDIRLHSSLFSCRELTSRNLTSFRLPPAPREFVGFPCPKTLLLYEVTISEHGGRELAALICASPLIEVLELSRVYLIGDDPEDEWVIQAPNLQKLKIVRGFPYGGRIEHLPRLQSGFLNGCNYAKFLMGMAQVTILQFATVSSWVNTPVLSCLTFSVCYFYLVLTDAL